MVYSRGPEDHINTKISHPGSNIRGKFEIMVCRILTLIYHTPYTIYHIPYTLHHILYTILGFGALYYSCIEGKPWLFQSPIGVLPAQQLHVSLALVGTSRCQVVTHVHVYVYSTLHMYVYIYIYMYVSTYIYIYMLRIYAYA